MSGWSICQELDWPPQTNENAVMPRYKLVPIYDPGQAFEFDAIDAAAVLNVAIRQSVAEGHVYESGVYLFSLRHRLNDEGCWVIDRRKAMAMTADELN